jgi:hypothetical protein
MAATKKGAKRARASKTKAAKTPAKRAPKPAKKAAKKPPAKPATAERVPPQNTQSPVERVEGGKWAPGASGNPGGRPRSKPLSDALRDYMAKPFPGDTEGRTYAEVIALGAIKRAIGGNIDALKEIGDRVEGRTAQVIHAAGRDGGPIEVANLTPEQRDEELAKLAAELGFSRGE